jgi:sarcosine oxidase subunit beta
MSTPSVCVIGGGASGLCSALQLTRRGVTEITVLEAEHIASGSSGLSAGIIETQYVEPLDIELRVRAMRLFNELEREHELNVVHNGYLRLARTEDAVARFARSVEIQHELGIADAKLLDQAEIGKLVPDMRVDDILCGLFGPSDGFIDGHLYCGLLGELVTSQGVKVLGRHRLLEADQHSSGRHSLRTDRGDFECDYVVNAAGPWAAEVAEVLGTELPLVPERHQAVIVHLSRELDYLMPSVMDYTPHTGETGLYFRHERAGQLLSGLHSEETVEGTVDPSNYARSADPEFLEGVAERISSRLPPLADSGLAHGWAGVYPLSPDGVPLVGPMASDPTVIAAAGVGGSGIQLSPVVGELVADWIVDGEPRAVSDGHALAPTRASVLAPSAD